MKKLRLILIPELSICDIGDFETIADHIRILAADIQVHIVKRRQLWWRQLAYLFRPCLYVAFYEAKKFRPLRGLSLHGQSIGKSGQYSRMQAAGFEVIPWQRIVDGKKYEAKDWGSLAIIKPDRGREGRGVRLIKPEDINFQRECGNGENLLIQRFVDTGNEPCYFRALTLLGELLYLRKTTNSADKANDAMIDGLPNPVANASHGTSELLVDDEVIEFAKRMAVKTFPEIPLLGQDIVRDRTTGRLYCLEVNPYGSTWHFSTATGLELQRRDNIDYKSQFGAFKIAANILIEKTRTLAR